MKKKIKKLKDKYELLEPENPMGYTNAEIKKICKDLKIKIKDFNMAFGINTCTMDENGKSLFYKCDIERALWILSKPGGVHHIWD